jgi:tetratricopeptide (TPR) repeat protein
VDFDDAGTVAEAASGLRVTRIMPLLRRFLPFKRSNFLSVSWALVLLLCPTCGNTQALYELSEVPLLPPYCKYAQDFRDRVPGANSPREIERWTSVLGPTFHHIHHYCYGLVATNRATFGAKNNQDRLHNLGRSIGEFDYIIEHAPRDFPLLPEVLTKKGENLIRLRRAPEGVRALEEAIELKPDYWPPYAYISDYYKNLGEIPKARETLEKGMANAADTKALKRRLADLDNQRAKRGTR